MNSANVFMVIRCHHGGVESGLPAYPPLVLGGVPGEDVKKKVPWYLRYQSIKDSCLGK